MRLISAIWYGYGTASWWLSAGLLIGAVITVAGLWIRSTKVASREQQSDNRIDLRVGRAPLPTHRRAGRPGPGGKRLPGRGVGVSYRDCNQTDGVQKGAPDDNGVHDLPRSA